MIRYLFRKMLFTMKKRYGYDVRYQEEILDTDLGAFLKFMGFQAMASHSGHLPVGPLFAARLSAILWDDCGPCAQLVINMALEAGVRPEGVRAIVNRDLDTLPDDTALVVRFTELVLKHDPEADDLREKILVLWGQKGLISLAYAIGSSRVYPTLKYALGYGRACSRVNVNDCSLVPYRLSESR